MTMIRIDPAEMGATSQTLRSCAAEAADIGSQLWSCAQCAMPADVRAAVDRLVSAADVALDVSAGIVASWAGDVSRRGEVALTDSLAAAIAVSPAVSATVPTSGMAVIGGGDPFGGITIGSAQDILGGVAIVGGTGSYGTATLDPGLGLGGMVIGGTSWSDGITPMGGGTAIVGGPTAGSQNPFMALAQTAENFRQRAQSRIDAIVSNPNSSPGAIGAALGAQWDLGDSISTILAPSRRDIEDKHFDGRPASLAEIQRISPHTV